MAGDPKSSSGSVVGLPLSLEGEHGVLECRRYVRSSKMFGPSKSVIGY
jgi:hypothetical protein